MRIKTLFLGKINYIFYSTFVLINLLIYTIYSHNLTLFALNVKQFTIADSLKYYSSAQLSEKFNCSSGANYLFCGLDTILFITVLLLIEVFAINKFIKLRKKIKKLPLLLYLLTLQVFVISVILIFGYTPEIVLAELTKRASSEIKTSIELLNKDDERSKRGILSSTDSIVKKLEMSSLDNFHIFESSVQKEAILSFLKIRRHEKDTFYRAIVITYQLNLPEAQKIKLSSNILLFPDDTLIISKIDIKDIEKLAPILANRMVVLEFKDIIKSKPTPNILFLNEIDYVVYQTREEERIKGELRGHIAYLNNYIKESDGIIQSNQNAINSYPSNKQNAQKEYDDYISRWGNWYDTCKNQSWGDSICEEGKTTIENSIKILRGNMEMVEGNKNQAEQNLKLQILYKDQAIKDLLIVEQNYQNFLKNPITAEFQNGVFNPPERIYIRFYDKEYKPLSIYLNTLLHEYLHYYSYNNVTNNLERFLDEGITDFLRVKIASKYMEKKRVIISYIYEVSIIETLTKTISENKLVPLYIDKDSIGFQKTFVEHYSQLEYDNFILKGKSLYYTSWNYAVVKKQYAEEINKLLSKN